jgi:hypothetical protein
MKITISILILILLLYFFNYNNKELFFNYDLICENNVSTTTQTNTSYLPATTTQPNTSYLPATTNQTNTSYLPATTTQPNTSYLPATTNQTNTPIPTTTIVDKYVKMNDDNGSICNGTRSSVAESLPTNNPNITISEMLGLGYRKLKTEYGDYHGTTDQKLALFKSGCDKLTNCAGFTFKKSNGRAVFYENIDSAVNTQNTYKFSFDGSCYNKTPIPTKTTPGVTTTPTPSREDARYAETDYIDYDKRVCSEEGSDIKSNHKDLTNWNRIWGGYRQLKNEPNTEAKIINEFARICNEISECKRFTYNKTSKKAILLNKSGNLNNVTTNGYCSEFKGGYDGTSMPCKTSYSSKYKCLTNITK